MLTISWAASGCSSDGATQAVADAAPLVDATAGDGGDAAAPDGAGGAGAQTAMVRFAHVSLDAPAIDVCIAPRGTDAFNGPLLAQLAATVGLPLDAGTPGIAFTQVSGYLSIDPGTYDLRFVAAGSASCASGVVDAGPETDGTSAAEAGAADAGTPTGPALPLPPDTTNLPAFSAGEFATVLLAGDVAPTGADPPFRALSLHDDSVLAGGGASLRGINALPGVAEADFAFESDAGSWSPLFTEVAFGAASVVAAPSQGKSDTNGYLTIAPFGPAHLGVRASGDAGADIASSQTASVTPGTVATVLATGKAGDPLHPPVLIVCADNAPIGGLLGACSVPP